MGVINFSRQQAFRVLIFETCAFQIIFRLSTLSALKTR